MTRDRGRITIVDIVMTCLVLVVAVVLAGVMYNMIDEVAGVVDPLTRILLSLTPPALFIMLILSVGVSARGGA